MTKEKFTKLLKVIYTIFRKDFRTKAVIFTIGFILWFYINLEKDFETNVQVPIRLTNKKSQRTLLDTISSMAHIKIKSKGKSIMATNLAEKLYFELDLSGVDKKKTFFLDPDIFYNKTSFEIELISVQYPQKINVVLDSLVRKKVPIELKTNYTLASGYVTTGGFSQEPDSVIVSGPLKKVTGIQKLYTETRIDSNLSNDYNISVPLVLQNKATIQYSHKSVNLFQKIAIKGSNVFKAPIIITNAPSNRKVMTTPISVEIKVFGPVNELQKISAEDFVIKIDYNQINKEDMTAEIISETDVKVKWNISNKKVKVIEF